jgi:nucleotide-binding universal stress UspA family protein
METILLCYDGSPGAKAAVRAAGALFDGTTTIVLTVWEGLSEVLAFGIGLAVASLDVEGIDRARERAAGQLAEEGTSHARASGLPAASVAVRCGASITETILEQAATLGADMIVLGSRGLGPVTSLLTGSVSRGVLQRADRPVLVVPGSPLPFVRGAARGGTSRDSGLPACRALASEWV